MAMIICDDNLYNSLILEPKRRKVESIPKESRRTEAASEKKERSAKTKVRDEQKELRREKKLGRKRVKTCFRNF